jgi:cytochrome c-type biogenesis protein CcmE
MKKSHIALIVLIAVAIGAMVTAINDSSTYADFDEAFDNPGDEFHVVGVLNKDKSTIYEPEIDPDKFMFYMLDVNNEERKIVLHRSKPQDFDRSEQIVLIGKADGEEFHATDILLKCPSKYTEGEIEQKAEAI